MAAIEVDVSAHHFYECVNGDFGGPSGSRDVVFETTRRAMEASLLKGHDAEASEKHSGLGIGCVVFSKQTSAIV
jgi:hypothetical protein